jgi:transposase InsO family protein
MIIVLGSEKLSLVEMEAFLSASESVGFAGDSRAEIYRWSEALLCHQEYWSQQRRAKGLIRAYLERMTGLSRAQCTRLIGQYRKSGRVAVQSSRRCKFPRRDTVEDVAALARVDRAHERLSGPATRHILKREFEVYGKAEFERLAAISNGHLYNLRSSPEYRQKALHHEKTRPAKVSIGERRKPAPNGIPGYLRIDTVHQGDSPEGKGLYHLNAVDEVTQWEIVAATPFIGERYLLPVLEDLLRQFPFPIKGFHSDNGSEFINRVVAGLLKKLLIEQTKSRARHSGDNGLVETKNAAIVRKHIGFGHIAPSHADRVNRFHRDFLNPYVNFHRPSAQPEVEIDARGRKRRLYKTWLTPLEKLLSLDRPEQYLRHGRSLAALNRAAGALSDTDAALRLQRARDAMFADIERAA